MGRICSGHKQNQESHRSSPVLPDFGVPRCLGATTPTCNQGEGLSTDRSSDSTVVFHDPVLSSFLLQVSFLLCKTKLQLTSAHLSEYHRCFSEHLLRKTGQRVLSHMKRSQIGSMLKTSSPIVCQIQTLEIGQLFQDNRDSAYAGLPNLQPGIEAAMSSSFLQASRAPMIKNHDMWH